MYLDWRHAGDGVMLWDYFADRDAAELHKLSGMTKTTLLAKSPSQIDS